MVVSRSDSLHERHLATSTQGSSDAHSFGGRSVGAGRPVDDTANVTSMTIWRWPRRRHVASMTHRSTDAMGQWWCRGDHGVRHRG